MPSRAASRRQKAWRDRLLRDLIGEPHDLAFHVGDRVLVHRSLNHGSFFGRVTLIERCPYTLDRAMYYVRPDRGKWSQQVKASGMVKTVTQEIVDVVRAVGQTTTR